MTTFLVIVILILNFIFQAVIMPGITILGAIPNTTLAIVVVLALSKGRVYGSVLGLVLGLIQDMLFSMTIGISALILFLIGYFTGLAEDSFARDNIINPVLFTLAGTVFYNGFFALIMFFLSREITFEGALKSMFSVELLLNAIAAILFYLLFKKVFTRPQIRFNRK